MVSTSSSSSYLSSSATTTRIAAESTTTTPEIRYVQAGACVVVTSPQDPMNNAVLDVCALESSSCPLGTWFWSSRQLHELWKNGQESWTEGQENNDWPVQCLTIHHTEASRVGRCVWGNTVEQTTCTSHPQACAVTTQFLPPQDEDNEDARNWYQEDMNNNNGRGGGNHNKNNKNKNGMTTNTRTTPPRPSSVCTLVYDYHSPQHNASTLYPYCSMEQPNDTNNKNNNKKKKTNENDVNEEDYVCVWDNGDCNSGLTNVYDIPSKTFSKHCPCDQVQTGACYHKATNTYTCAVSSQSCDEDTQFQSWKFVKLSHVGPKIDCKLCRPRNGNTVEPFISTPTTTKTTNTTTTTNNATASTVDTTPSDGNGNDGSSYDDDHHHHDDDGKGIPPDGILGLLLLGLVIVWVIQRWINHSRRYQKEMEGIATEDPDSIIHNMDNNTTNHLELKQQQRHYNNNNNNNNHGTTMNNNQNNNTRMTWIGQNCHSSSPSPLTLGIPQETHQQQQPYPSQQHNNNNNNHHQFQAQGQFQQQQQRRPEQQTVPSLQTQATSNLQRQQQQQQQEQVLWYKANQQPQSLYRPHLQQQQTVHSPHHQQQQQWTNPQNQSSQQPKKEEKKEEVLWYKANQ